MLEYGGAVQVDPMKPMLTGPGAKRLKLECDKPVSSFAFKFDWRRYNMAHLLRSRCSPPMTRGQGLTLVHFSAQPEPFLSPKKTRNTPKHPLIPPNTP